MPCGGIYPVGYESECFICREPGAGHYFEEYDYNLHAACAFRLPPDQLYVLWLHKHAIELDFDLDGDKAWPKKPEYSDDDTLEF